MATRQQLESALRNADTAGDSVAAKKLANALKANQYDTEEQQAPISNEQQEQGRNWYDSIRSVLQGVTLNTADEIGAGVAAVPASIATGKPYGEVYSDIHKQLGEEEQAYQKAHPYESGALEVAGTVLTGGTGLAKLGAKTAGMTRTARIGATAALGAAEGGVVGAAGADQGERIEEGLTGATIGAPLSVVGGVVASKIQKHTAIRAEIGKMLERGSTDKKVAKYMINGAGKVRRDPGALEAIKQGVDEGVVATVKGSAKADKSAMRKMLSVMERGKKNALFGAKNRASDVIGTSITKRINRISAVNRRAGSQIDDIAGSLKGQQADFRQPVSDFMTDLDMIGVKVVRGKDGTIKPLFEGADIEDIGPAEGLLKKLIRRMQKGNVDAYEAHRLKRFIDEQVSYGKLGEGLTGKTETIVKRLRHNLDQTLDGQFPQYKQVNDVYSETKGALDAIQDAAGKKIDLTGRNADKALGTLSRSLLSNIRSRANLINSLDDLDTVAGKYGGKFDDDITTQVLFADELDRLFGASAKTSLQGDTEKAALRAATKGVKEMAVDAAGAVIDKARGHGEEKTIRALRKLLADDGAISEAGRAVAIP